MQIMEYFLSIQGEGAFAGRLALFVRFAGCNLNCLGFGVEKLKNQKKLMGCDTLRAVFTKEFKDEYLNLSADGLLKRVLKLAKDEKPIIVITGGEPLLHHKKSEFIAFIKALLRLKFEVHFESNASIFIDFKKYAFYKKCVFAMSVKLENSGEKEDKRLNFKAIKAIILHSKQSFFKFVLNKNEIEKSALEIENILKNTNEALKIAFKADLKKSLNKNKKPKQAQIFCMPMGANEKQMHQNALKIAEFCIKMGYNYSDRLHIRLWGDKEGV